MKTNLLPVLCSALLFGSLASAQERLPQHHGDGSRPPQRVEREQRRGNEQQRVRQQYSLEQALSDQAQLHTIAFSGLAFLTGDFGSSTFIPPGKVADFFGFQYMRDIDAAGKGHNPMFLDRVAGNVIRILSDRQRALFERAAREQERLTEQIARKRLPLIAAFHRELSGDTFPESSGLSRTAVRSRCADIFALDATLAWERAKVFAMVAKSLDSRQKQELGKMRFGDFNSWPAVDREEIRDLRPRAASKLVSVGYMTLASEFFSWYKGSIEADTYFCPERHGTYFGGFYLKDMPAMGQKDYDISTSLTGDAGAAFIELLDARQRSRLTAVLGTQRKTLNEIVSVRRAIAARLREFLNGKDPSLESVKKLGRHYGELDGELAYEYVKAYVDIYQSMDVSQREKLAKLRSTPTREGGTAFLYSDRIDMPQTPDSSFLFR